MTGDWAAGLPSRVGLVGGLGIGGPVSEKVTQSSKAWLLSAWWGCFPSEQFWISLSGHLSRFRLIQNTRWWRLCRPPRAKLILLI